MPKSEKELDDVTKEILEKLDRINAKIFTTNEKEPGTFICGGPDLSIMNKLDDEFSKEDFSMYTEEDWDRLEEYLLSKIFVEK